MIIWHLWILYFKILYSSKKNFSVPMFVFKLLICFLLAMNPLSYSVGIVPVIGDSLCEDSDLILLISFYYNL